MKQHLAVFAILLGTGYLAVRFGGLPGSAMLAIPPIFLIYLAVMVLYPRAKAAKGSKR